MGAQRKLNSALFLLKTTKIFARSTMGHQPSTPLSQESLKNGKPCKTPMAEPNRGSQFFCRKKSAKAPTTMYTIKYQMLHLLSQIHHPKYNRHQVGHPNKERGQTRTPNIPIKTTSTLSQFQKMRQPKHRERHPNKEGLTNVLSNTPSQIPNTSQS